VAWDAAPVNCVIIVVIAPAAAAAAAARLSRSPLQVAGELPSHCIAKGHSSNRMKSGFLTSRK